MTLNGWTRLWVVASVLIGLLVGTLAFSTQPSISSVYESWCSDGVATIIPALEKAEKNSFDHADLENSIRNKGIKTCTDRLREIETKRVNAAVSDAISPVNAQHLLEEEGFPRTVRNHWFAAIGSWLIICGFLWLSGWSIAWVRRGFSKHVA